MRDLLSAFVVLAVAMPVGAVATPPLPCGGVMEATPEDDTSAELISVERPRKQVPPRLVPTGQGQTASARQVTDVQAPDDAIAKLGWRETVRLQTRLAVSGFSPGLIDGKKGRKTRTALEAFQKARGLPVTATLDEATAAALGIAEGSQVTASYTVTRADLDQITGPIPENWNERARLEYSGYADLTELLAERGWCSVGVVRQFNPGVDLDALKPGDAVTLPDVQTAPPLPKVGRLEIDLAEKLVKAFDASGNTVALFHCSIARSVEKRPVGALSVTVVVVGPNYTFNPESWPEVTNVTRRLVIAPGPRNPVGAAWIGLDKPGYGVHGTVRPQDIGKTGSHGCFRLANWDALRLAKSTAVGTPVEVRE